MEIDRRGIPVEKRLRVPNLLILVRPHPSLRLLLASRRRRSQRVEEANDPLLRRYLGLLELVLPADLGLVARDEFFRGAVERSLETEGGIRAISHGEGGGVGLEGRGDVLRDVDWSTRVVLAADEEREVGTRGEVASDFRLASDKVCKFAAASAERQDTEQVPERFSVAAVVQNEGGDALPTVEGIMDALRSRHRSRRASEHAAVPPANELGLVSSEAFETGAHEHDRMVTKPWVGDAKRVAKAVALFASEASLTQVHRSLLDQLVLYKVLELASIKTREERLLRELEGVAEEHALAEGAHDVIRQLGGESGRVDAGRHDEDVVERELRRPGGSACWLERRTEVNLIFSVKAL